MVRSFRLTWFSAGLFLALGLSAAEGRLFSPDGRLGIDLHENTRVGLSLIFDGHPVLGLRNLGLITSRDADPLGPRAWKIRSSRLGMEIVQPHVPLRSSRIESRFREVILDAGPHRVLTLRLYDRFLAYRFSLKKRGALCIQNETVTFQPLDDTGVYFPEEKGLVSHYEGRYQELPFSEIKPGQTGQLPLLMQTATGVNLLFNEADVRDFPCLFLERNEHGFSSRFPPVVLRAEPREKGPDRNQQIREEAPYIARVQGPFDLPWRVVTVSDDDRDLLRCEPVMVLSQPPEKGDWSWVRPGKVAWDWWNANNLTAVNFKTGLNTDTYKAYIDFAAEYGLEYIILDEGWSKSTTDVLAFNPDMKVDELIAYGREKGVGIILWLLWQPLDRDMDDILDTYARWGVKGIKVDFMQRADQAMVNFYARTAREAARRRLLVDFHGSFKPTGLHRTFPNVLSYEGVRGLEHAKWSDQITPDHDLTLPFLRMSAGPMDYTPGAMDNAGKGEFAIRFNRPMSQGTRVHQMALYAVFESPLQMLCDTPSRYREEDPCTRFISRIPTTWDETRVLEAKVADYLVLCRRKGDAWYLAALTDWTPREITVPLEFLSPGSHTLVSAADGLNAVRHAQDYTIAQETVTSESRLILKLAPGGGWIGMIVPVK